MRKEEILAYCATKIGAMEDFKVEWNAIRYLLKDKMFLMLGTNAEDRPIVTLKLQPEHGDLLRQQFPDSVIPGYYMNKTHWNSIFLDNPLEQNLMKNLIDESYQLVLQSLPKKIQKELLE